MSIGEILATAGTILFVVFFFGFCIFVHEWGHLLVALRRGLHVERFSIGFGLGLLGIHRRIYTYTRNGVEYVINILPFGGYVMLPQLEPSAEPQTSDGRTLPHAHPVDRILTALAGPVFNILFGFLLASVVWYVGIYRPAPATFCDVIDVPENSAEFKAGLRPDDRVVAVDGKEFTRGWADVAEMIVLTPGSVTLTVLRGHERREISYRPEPNPETEGLGYPFFHVRTPTVVHRVRPRSPAAAAGVQAGDVFVEVDGKRVEDAGVFIANLQKFAGKPMTIVVERQGQRVTLPNVTPRGETEKDKKVYRIGAELDAPYVLAHITPWDQFTNVIIKTGGTLRSLFTRHSLVKPKHMSGPIGIATIIGAKVYYEGVRGGLWLIVFVSFSLALFNLLPVPVLDGGHILLALVELGIRRRVPVRVSYVLYVTFASLLIGFMVYVSWYDVLRTGAIWKRISRPTTEDVQPAPAKSPPPAAPAPTPAPAPIPAPPGP